MATDKPRFSVTFTDTSFEKIRKYQKENNISTQSKAVARLVEIAISELESETGSKKSPDTAGAAPGDALRSILVQNFDQLNQEGQERLVETSDDMVSSGKYIKSGKTQLGEAQDT